MSMIDIKKLLYEICEDKRVFESGIDLIDSGLLDSYAIIEFFSKMEEEGIELYPTRIDRDSLRTVENLEKLIKDYIENHN